MDAKQPTPSELISTVIISLCIGWFLFGHLPYPGCQETATPVYQTLDGKYTCPDEDGPFKYARYEIGMLWYKQTRVLCCTEDCPTNCRLPEQLCHVKAIIPTEPSHYQRRERCDLFDLWS